MSTSAFANPYPQRHRDADTSAVPQRSAAAGRSPSARAMSKATSPEAASAKSAPGAVTAKDVFAAHPTSSWIGEAGEQLKLRVRVEAVEQGNRRAVTYVVRAENSGDLLALSGVVKSHVTRDDTPVTLLRDCFNPLRTA